MSAAIAGFGLGASLIIAIGAQNAFVLRQGLKREHVPAVVAICAGVDAALIAAGVLGFGVLVERAPVVVPAAAWGGAAFLIVYGALAFRSATRASALRADVAAAMPGRTLGSAVLTTLAVSLLNPHVYLDTVVLLGSVASQYAAEQRSAFALGAMSASATWFISLGFGARMLAPLFARPAAWRVLDVGIGLVMWWIAGSLIVGQIG